MDDHDSEVLDEINRILAELGSTPATMTADRILDIPQDTTEEFIASMKVNRALGEDPNFLIESIRHPTGDGLAYLITRRRAD